MNAELGNGVKSIYLLSCSDRAAHVVDSDSGILYTFNMLWQTNRLKGYDQAMDDQLLQRIALNPEVMTGKPVIRGTRIPAELIVRMLAQGIAEPDILHEYPRLQPEDVRAALAYAAQTIAHEDVFPTPAPK